MDNVKLQACDVAAIFVVNRYTVNLRPGWNLVSTPLMLTDPDMDAVLSHLVIHDTVKSVFTVKNENAGEPDVYTWSQWIPGDAMTFDAGQGLLDQHEGRGYVDLRRRLEEHGPRDSA